MAVDDETTRGGPVTAPGWFDDPFSRTGQRWWDGQQWTRRTRGAAGPAAGTPPSSAPTGSDVPSPPTGTGLGWLRPYGLVLLGLVAAFTFVGLTAPSAEESGVADVGDRRAAYWSCVDLLERQLPPHVTARFPGDSSATVVQDAGTWQVRAVVELETGEDEMTRAWECAVIHDDGTWRGTANLE
ncbi:MAG: DUF2510 domain-containing protein [Nitriliruptor sp.]|nr:MAG: DUF2510 domain-containing protein [Nitriliruptor sp.]